MARYAETDASKRANRNLPTAEDLNINIKIAGNEFVWNLLENKAYQKAIETDKPENRLDAELVKQIYNALTETTEYKNYIQEQSRDKVKEKEIIKLIFTNLMLPNESFIAHIEEHFNNWDDDGEMMEQLMLTYLQKPKSIQIGQLMTDDKWQFARVLLTTVLEKKAYCLDLIKPKLKNWDADRIALLDMILMRMGICELLYFETIPTKVTINEYIDLAKEYSTAQSGQFVNGILDNVHKELAAAGKINKINFKKIKQTNMLSTAMILLSADPKQGGTVQLLLMGGIILVFWLFMIRPQAKKAKEQKKFVDNMQKGDKVVTIAGIHGTVNKVNEDNTIQLEVSPGSYLKIEKSSISMEWTAAINKTTTEKK